MIIFMGVLFNCFHVSDEQDDNNCSCPRCFIHKLKIKHASIFRRSHTSATPQLSDVNPPSHGARERQDEGARDLQLQAESNGQPKCTQGNKTLTSKDQNFESSAKIVSSGVDGIAYTFASPDHEDRCPTCLEDYTKENPKITAKCSHHFHLSCIYEWLERSPRCPICRKRMVFAESN